MQQGWEILCHTLTMQQYDWSRRFFTLALHWRVLRLWLLVWTTDTCDDPLQHLLASILVALKIIQTCSLADVAVPVWVVEVPNELKLLNPLQTVIVLEQLYEWILEKFQCQAKSSKQDCLTLWMHRLAWTSFVNAFTRRPGRFSSVIFSLSAARESCAS